MPIATHFHSATILEARLLPGIHGLRGIAALAVVLFHIVHIANISVPPPLSFIASDFGKGVHLFFVLSAFSLMHSTEHTLQHPAWATEYFVKRFFRIAPLFYCILAGMVLWPALKAHYLTVSLESLILNLTFTFGLAPWTGIVWAGWTVGVEMLFYTLLPILLLTVRSSKGTLMLLVVSILISYASRVVLDAHFENTVPLYQYNWAHFSLPTNLCYFALGMYAFRIASETDRVSTAMQWGSSVLALVLLSVLVFFGKDSGWKPDPILWGFGFAALTLWQSKWPSSWCANRVLEYVGERSYSVYLLHPLVIVLLKSPIQSLYGTLAPMIGTYAYFVCVVFVLIPLMLLAEATYRLIEIPAIQHGRMITARIRRRSVSVEIQTREQTVTVSGDTKA